ncbi:MAG: Nif3-like dinuclear metal center hexameric protein [Muribaculaceae bacterium]|nr:Nif3-like dinuclear metal center hexameric protein [Muribaculaceae bacterium]
MVKVKDIASTIEDFAPKQLQESYDNAGLQVGNPEAEVSAVLLCLDVNEDVLKEAKDRECNMIVSHHPLIFHGIKSLTGADTTQRLVIEALTSGIAIYSAHTNLDSVWDGVSHEIARRLAIKDLEVLQPTTEDSRIGLGVVGNIKPLPKIEFLRKIKNTFKVSALRYSAQSPSLVVRRVAVCGGAGASLIRDAIKAKADIYVTGDVKYHDFTTYGDEIIIADIGHYESELCSREILSRVIREKFPELPTYFCDSESNPIKIL